MDQAQAGIPSVPQAPEGVMPPHKDKGSVASFYLHLGSIFTLYAVVTSLVSLLVAIINRVFPDVLNATYYYNYTYGLSQGLRWAIAVLIVLFPTYVLLMRAIHKDSDLNPGIKKTNFARSASYLTLALSGATLLIDLIVFINSFLGGEITARFISKVIVVLVVVGFVFGYYLWDLRRTSPQRSKQSAFIGLATVLILGSIVWGFSVMGSPFTQRAYRFDDTRIQHLGQLQSEITSYWQRTAKLPVALADLADPLYPGMQVSDPQTAAAYEYRSTGQTSFELCATFQKASPDTQPSVSPYNYYGTKGTDSWQHDAGRQCFTRAIDPSIYPPYTTTGGNPMPVGSPANFNPL